MGTVVFRAFPVSSHYNATFKIAGVLQKQYGHKIIYIGHDNFAESVRANGFEYLSVNSFQIIPNAAFDDTIPKPIITNKSKRNPLLERLRRAMYNRRSIIEAQKVKLTSEPSFKKLMDELKPDLVFIDTFYDYEIPMFYKNNIPFVIYQTKFSTNKERNIPPLTSLFIPSRTIASFALIEALWWRQSLFASLKKLRDHLYYLGGGPLATLNKVITTFGPPKNQLYTQRTFNVGFPFTWEFLLSPLELDFSRKLAPFQVVLAPAPDTDRSDTDFDYSFLDFHETVLKHNSVRKVVYCALGSISDIHSRYCLKFYNRVIATIEERDNVLLILSVGFRYNSTHFKTSGKNIFIFQKVPQLEVLKYADLMITHGGMQSITECVLSNTPMIVYPLSDRWDQNGNSARVLYHKIGLRGNIITESQRSIAMKIDSVLSNPQFNTNIAALGDKIRNSKNFDEGIKFLNSLIENKTPTPPPAD